MAGSLPRLELLGYELRAGVARQVTDLVDLRTDTVRPGALPDAGTVAVVGEVRPFEDVVRPAGSLTPSVICRVRVDAYPEPVPDPARRSFTDGTVVTDDVHAVPFVLADGTGRAVVDPVPRAPEEGVTPEATARPRAAYVTSDLRLPDAGLVVADRLRALGERRRSWLRATTDLADDAFVRVLERRVVPDDRLRVLGYRVRPGPDVERDVINVGSLRVPFRVAPAHGDR